MTKEVDTYRGYTIYWSEYAKKYFFFNDWDDIVACESFNLILGAVDNEIDYRESVRGY